VCLVVLLCMDQITAGNRIKSFLLKQKRIMQKDNPVVDPALQLKITDNNPFVRQADDDALKPSDTSGLTSRLQKLEARTAIRQAYETVQDIVHDVLSHKRSAPPPPPSADSSASPSSPAGSDASPPADGNLIVSGVGQTPDAVSPAVNGKIIGDIDGPQQPSSSNPTVPVVPDATTVPGTVAVPVVPAETPIQNAINPNVPPEPLAFDPESAPNPVLPPVVVPGAVNIPQSQQQEMIDNRQQLEAQTEQDEAEKIVVPEGGIGSNPTQETTYPVTVGPNDLPAETTRSVIVPTDKPPAVRLDIPPNTVTNEKVLKDVEAEVTDDTEQMDTIAKDVVRIARFVPHHRHPNE